MIFILISLVSAINFIGLPLLAGANPEINLGELSELLTAQRTIFELIAREGLSSVWVEETPTHHVYFEKRTGMMLGSLPKGLYKRMVDALDDDAVSGQPFVTVEDGGEDPSGKNSRFTTGQNDNSSSCMRSCMNNYLRSGINANFEQIRNHCIWTECNRQILREADKRFEDWKRDLGKGAKCGRWHRGNLASRLESAVNGCGF